jgi:hypothetical protein
MDMKIRTHIYVKERIDELRKHYDAEISAIRRAVDKYSDTNDEWKELHNGLQRQMEKERTEFLKKDELSRIIQILVAVAVFILALVSYFKK